MMLLISRICIGFAIIVVIIVHGYTEKELRKHLKERLDKIKSDEEIHGFKLLQRIGKGSTGFVYKGERIVDNKIVALKFAAGESRDKLYQEYKIYTYLHAIDKTGEPTNAERFGIPTLYYCDKWEKFLLMVISYLDGCDLINQVSKKKNFEEPIDSLILFRDFVIQSKYIHSCGVRHDDIKPENIIIDNSGRSFLLDFDVSCKLKIKGNGTTPEYASRQYHKDHIRNAASDWESFLYTMCYINHVQLDWLFPKNKERYTLEECAKSKYDTDKTIATIQNTEFKSENLKEVILAFAREVFNNVSDFPDYESMYTLICAKIKKMGKCPETARFTWTSAPKAIPVPDLRKDIISPDSINFDTFDYPTVDQSNFLRRSKKTKQNTKSFQ